MNVEYFIPTLSSLKVVVGGSSVSTVPLRPFASSTCSFVAALSDRLMKDARIREYPDVASFAYWCRKSNVLKKKTEYEKGEVSKGLRLGRGLAFHIAPSNVPVNFAFSFIFSLLAGNSNIVRLPTKPFGQIDVILEAVASLLPDYPLVAERTVFLSYPSSSAGITEALSANADVRVIWGGDETVGLIRSMKTKPRCQDIAFSDRYSIAMFDGRSLDALNGSELSSLARKFYNDTYLMDQNACSSPQLIVWENASPEVKSKFWDAVKSIVDSEYRLQPAIVMDKYVQYCSDAINGRLSSQGSFAGDVTVVSLEWPISAMLEAYRGRGGYFYEIDDVTLKDLSPLIGEKVQTLVYYGVDPERLRSEIIESGMRGVDRIVPVGSALDIDLVWDGYDLISAMTRIVDAR